MFCLLFLLCFAVLPDMMFYEHIVSVDEHWTNCKIDMRMHKGTGRYTQHEKVHS